MNEQIKMEFESYEPELKKIALYLCDDNEQEAKELLYRTKELALKYNANGDLLKWFKGIIKFLYLDKIRYKMQIDCTDY